jgi:NADPH:quinone reductase-like Zn-dependent oxidoreductase
LSYTNEVISGQRKYVLDLPLALGVGAVGRVRAIGPDATRLKVGDWVLCDPTVRSRDDALAPDILLQGWSTGGGNSLTLQRYYRHGSFAEQMRVPTENAIAMGEIAKEDAARWCTIGIALVPYGGFLAVNLQPGETALVSGATGGFGSAAVAVALAMGAACVVAPGRNEKMLAELVRRHGPRVRPVMLSGSEEDDRERMKRAAPGPIDCVLDILPPGVAPSVVRAAVMTVRTNGRVVLMGGVGGQGGLGLELPYPWIMRNNVTLRGQWMYPREASVRMIAMMRAGLLSLDNSEVAIFDLDHINEAVAHAASNSGAFETTVLQP